MYPPLLGKFYIPAHDPEWAGKITYTAEPPVVVRGSLNPWETERQREIWLAEESAWKAIVAKQALFWQYTQEMKRRMQYYNTLVANLESLAGQPVGLQKLTSFTQKIPFVGGMVGGIMGLVNQVLGMLTGGLLGGGGKKAEAEALIGHIEQAQAKLAQLQAKLMAVMAEIEALVNQAEGIRASQPERVRTAIAQTETAYQDKRTLDRWRASVLRERNRQVALMPRRGGSNGL